MLIYQVGFLVFTLAYEQQNSYIFFYQFFQYSWHILSEGGSTEFIDIEMHKGYKSL